MDEENWIDSKVAPKLRAAGLGDRFDMGAEVRERKDQSLCSAEWMEVDRRRCGQLRQKLQHGA